MAISETGWAQIYAKAWYESTQPTPTTFQDDLEQDPAAAINAAVRKDFGISRADTILDMDYDTDPVSKFLKDDASPADLLKVITSGSIPPPNSLQGQHISRSTWRRPTDPKEIRLPETYRSPTISLQDWTRIYAYLWYQYLNNDVVSRARFENDPAATLPDIVAGIKALSNVTINYVKGTHLVDLGYPPDKDKDPAVLKSIQNDKGAKQYSHKPMFSS
jgi:hypothetical protein